MTKRIIAVFLLIALTVSALTACGNSEENIKDENERTLFIYMCGSNLETKQGLASKNIDELLSADTDGLNIVIQTGGAKKWRSHDISPTANQRYEIRDGELVLIETLTQLNMGAPETLTDFLKWGRENYPTDRSMLVLWDHGAGAAKGICFDENYSYDGLSLLELDKAIKDAEIKTPFELIGFDACLMGMFEVAALVNNNAKYMVASEEIEPSGGWDYKALCEAYASGKEPLEVGKTICDSYMEKCKKKGKDLLATLSVFDLSHVNEMRDEFAFVASFIFDNINDPKFSSYVIQGMNECEKFGGDNSYQGSANMLDMISFIREATEDVSFNTVNVFMAVADFVPYTVFSERRKLGGVSFYYPMVYDRKEIEEYVSLGICEEYERFLDEFYLHNPDSTVVFSDKGKITESGAFSVSLTPESAGYLSNMDYILMKTDADGTQHILYSDCDVDDDLDTMTFTSTFGGMGIALDGHLLFNTAISENYEFDTFSAPVVVNGEKTSLRFAYMKITDSTRPEPRYQITGLWSGYDENGLPVNDMEPLKQGDRVQVVTDAVTVNGRTTETLSEEFVIGEDGGSITEIPLDDGEYQYVFVATDIFGNTYTSDMATFELSGGTANATKVEEYKVK